MKKKNMNPEMLEETDAPVKQPKKKKKKKGSGFLGRLIRRFFLLLFTIVILVVVALVLGLSVAYKMQAADFLTLNTLVIMGLGLVAFIFDTFGGVAFAKLLNLFLKDKINPMIGAAGISAFPMSSRVVHKLGREEDPYNYLLMHAAGANVSGQIASVIAGGLIMMLVV